jgi:hypothetical protein
MTRYSIFLSSMAVAGFLLLGTQQGQAQSDVEGMDHSKLNHGVLGQGTHQDSGDRQHGGISDVAGMDHSKLNQGVRGAAR